VKLKAIALLIAFIQLIGFSTSVYAMTDEQSNAIQSFLDDAQRISRAPGIAVAVFVDGETHFFSAGVANRNTGASVDEETLWVLASTSKAFTGLGVLLLEEQGLLSLSDSITEHLPWLTFQYQGQPIDMQDIRLYHFLHHTSGIGNSSGQQMRTSRLNQDTLQISVESMIDSELAFYPGERFEYGTRNYNILGLVIETVTGQSYESFMEEQVFLPLGLTQTFAYRNLAESTDRLAVGYAVQFILFTTLSDSPETRGGVPEGGLISSARDMERWMRIQLGVAEDIPEIFKKIISRSHEQGQSVVQNNGNFYAAGWNVNAEQTRIEHTGNSPGWMSNVVLFPEEQIGITLLTNAVINWDMVDNIKGILDGNLNQAYPMYFLQVLDILMTAITIFSGLAVALFIYFGWRRPRCIKKALMTKRRVMLIVFWAVITIIMFIISYMFPSIVLGSGWTWPYAFIILPYSHLTGMLALALLSVSITWFVAVTNKHL